MSIGVAESRTASLTERVAEEIRVVMTRRRVKQSELARALGKSEQWVSVRLRGVQPLDLNDLEAIAAVLDVEVAQLLPRINEGRVLQTTGEHSGDQGRRITIRKFGLTNHPHPNGHPKRTQPDPSTRRPARVRAACAAS